jgi:hypothetical protein
MLLQLSGCTLEGQYRWDAALARWVIGTVTPLLPAARASEGAAGVGSSRAELLAAAGCAVMLKFPECQMPFWSRWEQERSESSGAALAVLRAAGAARLQKLLPMTHANLSAR